MNKLLALTIFIVSGIASAQSIECTAAYKGVPVRKVIQGQGAPVLSDNTLRVGDRQYYLSINEAINGVSRVELAVSNKVGACDGESKCYDLVSAKKLDVTLKDKLLVALSFEDILVVCQNQF